jgi:NOL1/NOP2/fmu family ribosome biogenesis protein
MASFTALNSKARKEFYGKLKEYFGLPDDFTLEGLLFVTTKNKYYLVDQKFVDISQLHLNISTIGLYIAEITNFGEIRVSLEGSAIIGPHATEHILELSNDDAQKFIRGDDLVLPDMPQQFYLLFSEIDGKKLYFGCGKYKEGYLFNFIPKSRRVRD